MRALILHCIYTFLLLVVPSNVAFTESFYLFLSKKGTDEKVSTARTSYFAHIAEDGWKKYKKKLNS